MAAASTAAWARCSFNGGWKCHLAAQQFAFIISHLFLVVLLFDCLNPSIGLVVFAFN
jgi:hypothetical protein